MFEAAFDALAVVFLVREVGVSAGAVGVLLSVSGVGGLLGAGASALAAERIGVPRAVAFSLATTWPLGVLIPLTHRGPALALFVTAEMAKGCGIIAFSVASATFRQRYCPPESLTRVNATVRVATFAALTAGGLLGGGLASLFGIRAAVWIAVVGGAICGVAIAFSPLRHLRSALSPTHPPRGGLSAAPSNAGACT